jgi:hypothetical protein
VARAAPGEDLGEDKSNESLGRYKLMRDTINLKLQSKVIAGGETIHIIY